jgi:hypothetical protein
VQHPTTFSPILSGNNNLHRGLFGLSILAFDTTMPRPANREEVLARLRKTVADGSIIVGAGAGECWDYGVAAIHDFHRES